MTLAILIPAAGNSSRLGQPKQLVNVNGQPLLQDRIKLCATLSAKIYCILGANGHQIRQKVIHPQCRFLFNPRWQEGMGQSIAFGVEHLPNHLDAVMIVLADQWAITATDLHHLVDKWQQQPDKIHASFYQQNVAVPAIFPASYFAELKQLGPDNNGARSLLEKYRQDVISVPMSNAAPDLDEPEQLKQMQQQLNQQQPLKAPQSQNLTENNHGNFID